MTLWMLWATVVTGLLGAAASFAERALRRAGRPVRVAWIGAFVVSTALVVGSRLPAPAPTPTPAPNATALGALPAWLLEGLAGRDAAPAALERGSTAATVLWATATSLLLAALLGGLWRLGRRARHWAPARVGDLDVLISDDFGPALLGVHRPRIVLPRWALALPHESLRIACLHEEEHRVAGDTWVLLAGSLAVAAAPWNAALWWVLARLRLAVEVDCDRRVLGHRVSRVAYGTLLLELGTRQSGPPTPVVALAKPPSLLERRLKTMIAHERTRGSALGGVLAAATGALLVVAACETPAPTSVAPQSDAATEATGAYEFSERNHEVRGQVERLVADEGRPLIFVNGVETDHDMASLAALDIERVEVIKGAAAASLYGERGANGVILVTSGGPASAARISERPAEHERAGQARRALVEAELRARARGESQADASAPATGDGRAAVRRALTEAELRARGGASATFAPAEDVRVFVDGERFEGDLADLDRDRIDSIELVRGPDGPTVRITLKKSGRS